MNVGGRPLEFDEAKSTTIVGCLADGCPLETAAAAAGISKVTLQAWLRRGARGETPELAAFSRAVRSTVANWEQRQLKTIQSASLEQWQAAAWLLERRYPKKYGRRGDEAIIEAKVEARLKLMLKRARQKPALKAVG